MAREKPTAPTPRGAGSSDRMKNFFTAMRNNAEVKKRFGGDLNKAYEAMRREAGRQKKSPRAGEHAALQNAARRRSPVATDRRADEKNPNSVINRANRLSPREYAMSTMRTGSESSDRQGYAKDNPNSGRVKPKPKPTAAMVASIKRTEWERKNRRARGGE